MVKWSPSWTQNGAKSKTKTKMQKEMVQAHLRELLEPSWTDLWAILAEFEAILGPFGGGWGGGNRCFSLRFSILFEKTLSRIHMVILARLGVILVPLGVILGASWADLGATWAPKRAQKGAQDDPKTTPFFSLNFGAILVRFGGAQGPSMAPKGVGA